MFFYMVNVVDHGDPKNESAVDALAARLYWNMERLDPSQVPQPRWRELDDRTKLFYRSCVSDLLSFRKLLSDADCAGER